MENWLGTNITINGGDTSYGLGVVASQRLDGEFYFTSVEIDDYTPENRNSYDINRVNIEFDGTVSGSTSIGSGLVSERYPGFAFGYGFASDTYKVVSTTETVAGFQVRVSNAVDATLPLGPQKTILDGSTLAYNVQEFGLASFYDSFYAVGWLETSSTGALEAYFQAFDATDDTALSTSPVFVGNVGEDTASDFSAWNPGRVAIFTEFDDTFEGNTDIALSTRNIDGTVDEFDRNYIIDLDKADIDKIDYSFTSGQVGNANMLFVTLDDDIASATPKSRISFSFVEDTGDAGTVLSDFSFEVDGAESDFQFRTFVDQDADRELYFMTFIDGGDLKAATFDAASMQLSDRFTVQAGVTVDDFAGISHYGDGRFLVNWYQDNDLGGRDLVAQIVDTRGPGPLTIAGTAFADQIAGSTASDRLSGEDGNDTLAGGLGNDYVTGGLGDDLLSGGGGNDTLLGGAGNNVLDGGAGFDTASYYAASGAVRVNLSLAGTQAVGGGEGTDTLISIERVQGSNNGNDWLIGSAANETLVGWGGNDRLNGGTGNDVLSGGAGNDVMLGIGGNDTLDGGAGFDTASYYAASGGVTVDLALTGAQALGGGAGTDTLASVERVHGSNNGADTLLGSAGAETLNGWGGNDLVYGRGGNDTLAGGAGSDLLSGGMGNDRLYGQNGGDTLRGDFGNDLLVGGAGYDYAWYYAGGTGGVTVDLTSDAYQAIGGGFGFDRLVQVEGVRGTSAFGDTISGDGANNALFGYGGNDVLTGRGGADKLYGGAGNDTFVFEATTDSRAGGADSLYGWGNGADRIDLSAIDAIAGTGADDAFSYVGGAGYSGAGQLRFATNGTDGYVLGDVDGDGANDLVIVLAGQTTALTAGDFVF